MKFNRLSFIFIVALVVIVGAAAPAFAADVNDVYNLLNNTTNSYLNTIKNSNAQIESYSSLINTKVGNIYTDIHTYLPSINQISTYNGQMSQDLITIRNSLINSNGSIFSELHSVNTLTNSISSNVSSIQSGLSSTLPDIHDSVVQLQEVLASDEDLAIRQSQAQRVDQINDDFLDPSGDASVSLGDIGTTKDSVFQLKNALSGGASASTLWGIFSSNSDGWGWFSQATLNDLDQTGSGGRRSAPRYEFLDSYYDDVYSALGGDYND